MIIFDQTNVVGFQEAVRGMRNSFNSWDKSDSLFDVGYHVCFDDMDSAESATMKFSGVDIFNKIETTNQKFHKYGTSLGPNDLNLMTKLASSGHAHAKYRRMIVVYVDIIAPLYWWKEFDTYKVGTVANSCSTMHKITDKEFELSDFSWEWMADDVITSLEHIIDILNNLRAVYNTTKDKHYWYSIIQLLPESYEQKRTVMMNYEVLAGIYKDRKGHRLSEWETFREWIQELPYSELITLGED